MSIKIFAVGGSVRDKILGRVPKDFDYVVVGADIQYMIDKGFTQVGAAFPVFLHPDTGDQYALARKEKKTGVGYQGFDFEFGPHVSLEEDLFRRDLTIGAIAMDLETLEYIDPYNGIQDLKNGIIRHVSDAFSEDPLRVLRVARFASRYNFEIDPKTKDLCKIIVNSEELNTLSYERIWSEIDKMLAEDNPEIGLSFLKDIGAIDKVKILFHLFNRDFCKYEVINLYNTSLLDTIEEKRMLHLNLHSFSQDQLEEFKIPKSIARECKFYREGFEVITKYIKPTPNAVLYLFESYRNEIRNGDLIKIRNLLNKICTEFNSSMRLHITMDVLDKIYTELLNLDFTDLVKDLPKSEIKEFVKNKKLKTICNFNVDIYDNFY